MAHHGGDVNAMAAQATLAREISHIEEQLASARVANDTFRAMQAAQVAGMITARHRHAQPTTPTPAPRANPHMLAQH